MNLNNIFKTLSSSKNATSTLNTDENTKEPSIDIAFSLSQSSVDFQLGQVDTLDAKADSAQTSATTLVGAALVLEAILLPMNNNEVIRIIQIISLLPLLLAYIVVMVSSNQAYKVENYDKAPAPSAFTDGYYLSMPEHKTKSKILNALAYVFEKNQKTIEKKTKLINRAITWRTIEAMALVFVLLVQVILTLFVQVTK